MNENNQLGMIKISGEEAYDFLQGQFTCDMREVTEQDNKFSAYCTAQGKVLATFYIKLYKKNYLLILPSNVIPLMLSQLKKYAVFSKVKIEETSAFENELPNSTHDWFLKNILENKPIIFAATSGKFFPHDLNLQETGAISFTKGCYLGQEIIARMHYKATLKRHMKKVILSTQQILLAGEKIYDDNGHEKGIIVDARFDGQQQHALVVQV